MKVGSGGNLGLSREYPKKLFGPVYSWRNCALMSVRLSPGTHHKRMERGERQEVLSGQYFFTCLCRPCMEDGEKEQLAQVSIR